MRTIKFRAKRLDNNEWVYGYYLYIEEQDKHYILTGNLKDYPVDLVHNHLTVQGFEWVGVDGNTVCQMADLEYRGEIYDGDLLRIVSQVRNPKWDWVGTDEPSTLEREDVALVEFDRKNCCYRLKVYNKGKYKRIAKFKRGHLCAYQAKVVGNIYDNKELLEK